MQIVLAKLVEDFKVVKEGQPDLGIRPKLKQVKKAMACMWLQDGTPEDVKKAELYANSDGYKVFLFVASEQDPLGMAKKLMEQE